MVGRLRFSIVRTADRIVELYEAIKVYHLKQ